MYRLENTIRPYAWGSTTAIAGLLGREPSGGPEAELWIGAHPGAPSMATTGNGAPVRLDELVASAPRTLLGPPAAEKFGRLPFLAKVLAAASPLSLQVHPTAEQAAAGFDAEEAAGVPADAPHRNYKDRSHKPEMILALTPFEALCGFRSPAEAAAAFRDITAGFESAGRPVPQLLSRLVAALLEEPEEAALRNAFGLLIDGGAEAAELVNLTAAVLGGLPDGGLPDGGLPDGGLPDGGLPDGELGGGSREMETVRELAAAYPGDPGVLLSLLLNRVSLQPGEAVYLPAGNIHAYLSGLGIEVMASSDNVLRGGLTSKHVDVPELLRTVEFRALGVPRVFAEETELGQRVFRPPFEEFQLQQVQFRTAGTSMASSDVPLVQNGPLVVLVVSGSLILDTPHGDLLLRRGESAFIGAHEAPVIAKQGGAAGGTSAFAITCAPDGPR